MMVVLTLLVCAMPVPHAQATHEESVCGRLLEYVPAPSNDLAHGYAHVRLATPSGDRGVLFHHTNASGAPSRLAPGATQRAANVCISGPYVHVVGSSPYVSPYDLRLASLPSTNTADSGGFTICGRMNYYSRSAPGIGINGVDYRLVGTGPVPDALGAIGTAMTPEVVRLTGRLVDASTKTVANYTIVRVPSCTLPSTSTTRDSALARKR